MQGFSDFFLPLHPLRDKRNKFLERPHLNPPLRGEENRISAPLLGEGYAFFLSPS
jgi:hypothetical protein